MMQDGKALQQAPHITLGQNFAIAFNVKILNELNKEEFVYTATSWGVSTRLISALVMSPLG